MGSAKLGQKRSWGELQDGVFDDGSTGRTSTRTGEAGRAAHASRLAHAKMIKEARRAIFRERIEADRKPKRLRAEVSPVSRRLTRSQGQIGNLEFAKLDASGKNAIMWVGNKEEPDPKKERVHTAQQKRRQGATLIAAVPQDSDVKMNARRQHAQVLGAWAAQAMQQVPQHPAEFSDKAK